MDQAKSSTQGNNALLWPKDNSDTGGDRRTNGSAAVDPDFFIVKEGVRYAGLHLLLDLWNARNLTDPTIISQGLVDAAVAAGASVLHVHLHQFTKDGGVSGVVVLAESHISIHTWPERAYAAIDIFMCGLCDPYDAVPIIQEVFRPGNLVISESRRGLGDTENSNQSFQKTWR